MKNRFLIKIRKKKKNKNFWNKFFLINANLYVTYIYYIENWKKIRLSFIIDKYSISNKNLKIILKWILFEKYTYKFSVKHE